MMRWSFVATILACGTALAEPEDANALIKRGDAASNAGEHEVAAQLYQRAYKLDPQPILISKVADEYYFMKRLQWALTYYCEYLSIATDEAAMAEARAQARAVHVELERPASSTDEEMCRSQGENDGPPPIVASKKAAPASAPEHADTPSEHSPGMSPLRVTSLAVAGIGVVALGAGIYFGLQARALDDEITNHPVGEPWPVDLRDREARGASYNRRAIVLMASGGVLAAAGIAGFFVLRPSTSTSASDAVTVAPVIASDGLGFAAAGRF